MKKISLFAVSLMIAMVLCGVSEVSAEEVSIPNEMQPETIIEYISDTEYVVLQGGESNQEKKIVNNELPETGAYIVEKLPKPVKGMKVTYATDGYILDIIAPVNVRVTYEEEIVASLEENPSPYMGEAFELYATWGSYPNKLYKTPYGNVIGTGRATTFSDTIGQANHRLVKGDVATKQAYDNCPTGTVLQVRHNGKFVNMKKWDVGSMPNAVLDIWKTGVEYWGYKWGSTFSIPGYVEYEYCL